MYIYPLWGHLFENEEANWFEDHDFDGENYWDSQEVTFPHLKSIMIYGYINEPYVIQMVKFLLRSAMGLEKIVISTKESFKPTHQSYIFTGAIERQKDQFTSEQLLQFLSELFSFPRSSSQAVIDFS
ncbi:hypothetical protein ACJIZ3_011173 [Penstemon smallii]|uniref:FBD domain-containing protein n=1 Tax=Penstemon smallii TaxID=265156 RepID=A0ABD3UID7_9LAMI